MADFIISPYAISFTNIKNSLQSYIQNKSDVTSTWKDFYTAGAGQTVLELDAAVAAFYAFHFIIGRRESFLTVAQNYNSVVGGALDKGYNCSRGHNVHIRIQIVPTKTQSLSKWSIVGSYGEYDVVLLEDAILNKGIATTIDCVIGNSSVQTVPIKTTDLQQFVFTAANTTDDVRLILTDREVPFSTELKDAVNDNYIMLTNPYGSVDVFYLNNGNYKYTVADTLNLQFIERNNITFGGISKSTLVIDVASQVDDIILIEDRLDVEDKEHIRLAAPIYHETNNVVRARKDYVKFLKENNALIIDANDKDLNPGLIALTYLKKYDSEAGTSLLTAQEKQDYVKFMMSICPDGVAKAFIEDPVRVVRSLAITLWQKSNENIQATIEDDIDNILDTYRDRLAPVLDLNQIEHDIEQLPGVKIARVDLGASEYENNKKYKLYDVVTVPKILVGTEYQTWTMYCGKIQSKTGDTEPDWATAGSIGDQIQDNNFIWENSNKYTTSINASWNKDGTYELYSDINVGYEVPPKQTLATQPLWGAQLKKDGNVTWNKLKDYGTLLSTRQNNTKYVLNQQVIVEANNQLAVYNAVGVTHKTSASKPNWNVNIDEFVIDNAITWKCLYNARRNNYNYLAGDLVAIGKDDKLYVYIALSDGTTGDTEVLDGSAAITDGTITWSLQETLTGYTNWATNTEIPIDRYINGDDKYFISVSVDNTTSGTATFYNKKWLQDVTDNNIIWKLDTFELQEETINSVGKSWKPCTEYEIQDIIICSSASSTYIYQANFVGETTVIHNNVIYSVVNYAGTTGDKQPVWGDDNVVDNDILWTKTENISGIKWEPSVSKKHGDIITTDQGYYVFSSVLGTSGATDPDWTGIENNQVKDNNITWVRISDSVSMALQWNEYLDLKAESPKIV